MRILVALALTLWPLWAYAEAPRQAQISAMGGIPINISAWGIGQAEFDVSVSEISARIEQLEAMMSTYRESSEVSRLNRGEQLESIPADLFNVLTEAQLMGAETGGIFDITVKPLVNLWKQCGREDRLPSEEEIAAAHALMGYQHFTLTKPDQISIDLPGLMLDLGGIAKGYFADEAVAILRAAGAERCLVDIGGDITTWQQNPGTADPFRVGIRNPLGDRGEILAVLEIPTGAVVTSGDYERYVEIQGERYCHIFDPRTGWPVEGMHSVTLLAPTGWGADALATAVFVMGLGEGREFLESHQEVQAVLIGSSAEGEMEVYVSGGLTEMITFVE